METRQPQFNQDPGIPLAWAIDLAENAHWGQVDKGDGGPYIRHPLRVMAALEPYGVDAQVVAVLHDVVEDSPDNSGPTTTIDNLKEDHGVADHALEAIDALTKRPGETYEHALERVKRNPLATLVKIADNKDNSNPKRLALLSEEDRQKALRKYPAALEQLIEGDEWLAAQAELIEKRLGEIYGVEQAQFNQEGPLHLNFSIDPEFAVDKLSRMKQSQVIHNLYGATKGYFMTEGGNLPTAHSVDGLIQNIYAGHDPARSNAHEEGLEVWDDNALDRILRDRQPKNLEEEELMRVFSMRAAMTMFSYTALALSGVPADIKAKFATESKGEGIYADSSHLVYSELEGAQTALWHWEYDNPGADIPLDFDERGEAQIKNICERVNELIDFYNQHSSQLLRSKSERPRPTGPVGERDLDSDRAGLIASMLELLGTEKEAADMRQLRWALNK